MLLKSISARFSPAGRISQSIQIAAQAVLFPRVSVAATHPLHRHRAIAADLEDPERFLTAAQYRGLEPRHGKPYGSCLPWAETPRIRKNCAAVQRDLRHRHPGGHFPIRPFSRSQRYGLEDLSEAPTDVRLLPDATPECVGGTRVCQGTTSRIPAKLEAMFIEIEYLATKQDSSGKDMGQLSLI